MTLQAQDFEDTRSELRFVSKKLNAQFYELETENKILRLALRLACNAVVEQKGFPNSDYWIDLAREEIKK